MVMKTYLKTLARAFTKHITRFLSIIFIVLISVGFISGIGTSTDKIKYSLNDYYKANNVSDFILKSTSDGGFSDKDIAAVRNLYGGENVNTGASFEAYIGVNGEKQLFRLYFLNDFDSPTVNKWDVVEKADFSDESGDIKVACTEVSDNKIKGISAGTEIELDFGDILKQLAEQNGKQIDPDISLFLDNFDCKITVVAGDVIKSPLTFANDGEISWRSEERRVGKECRL